MSQENVDLARSAWTAEAFVALFDESIVMDGRQYPLPDLPEVVFGRDDVIAAVRHYWGTWDEYAIDPMEFIDAGQSVVITVRERGQGKTSGVPVERQQTQVWTFRNGRIVRWELFGERADALEAAGLSA